MPVLSRRFKRIREKYDLELVRLYGWGEHSKRTQPVLGL
jgi:hypothetical protein